MPEGVCTDLSDCIPLRWFVLTPRPLARYRAGVRRWFRTVRQETTEKRHIGLLAPRVNVYDDNDPGKTSECVKEVRRDVEKLHAYD